MRQRRRRALQLPRIRLWVVYVTSFQQQPDAWARNTIESQQLRPDDVMLAIATGTAIAYSLQVPDTTARGVGRRHDADRDRTACATVTGQGPRSGPPTGWTHRRPPSSRGSACCIPGDRRSRRAGAAAVVAAVPPQAPRGGAKSRGGSSPPTPALATVPLEALDDLSKQIVVDVDNAVRTSENELQLAVEEFGDTPHRTVQASVGQRESCAGTSVHRAPDPR